MDLKAGMEYETRIIVEQKHTAEALGSGGAPVLATPMMIALMENAAMLCVADCLEKGFQTVGTKISVEHVAATPVGAEARAIARLEGWDGKRLSFTVEAYSGEQKIGFGSHERFIVNYEKFMSKLS